MQHKTTNIRIIVALTAALVLACVQAEAQFLIQDAAPRAGTATEAHNGGEIDWGNEYYYASGQSTLASASEEPDGARAYQRARNDAKTKAVANLLMTVDATPVSGRITAKDLISKEAALQQLVESSAASAEIISERQSARSGDTVVIVIVRAPVYGSGTVGSAILKSGLQQQDSAANINVERRDTGGASAASGAGPYSSLIVDCTGADMERAVIPVIRRADKTAVWPVEAAKLQVPQAHGIAAYVQRLDEARRASRAGANSLIVKAIGRAGSKFMCDPVISDADAQRITEENRSSHFLDKCNVIFIVD